MTSPSIRISSASSSAGGVDVARRPSGLTLRELAVRQVDELKPVGPKLADGLAAMGIVSVLDLLQHYPRRYLDRTDRAEIAELSIGDVATVDAEVRAVHARRTRDRKRTIVQATVYDGTGLLEVVFFNQPWRERQLAVGAQVSLFGKVEQYRGKRQMTNPVVDVLVAPDGERSGEGLEVTGAIVPVYPQSGKAEVHTWQLRRAVASCLERTRPRGFADPLDEWVRDELYLTDRGEAYEGIHRPGSIGEAMRAAHRLKFDEFLRMQLALVARKRALAAEAKGISHAVDGPLVRAFHAALPFPLTGDQLAAIDEIGADLAGHTPMHRLLQGEVGSGKTVVALTTLLTAVQGGHQGAFMAPTEVLAEQHELTMRALLDGLTVPDQGSLLGERPVRVALLTNRTGAAERRRIADGLRAGEVDIVVGTHALIYEGVAFASLGVVVIDEQHRFGVEQRDLLRCEGGFAGRAGDDRHPDPADRGDAHLRRPRPHRAARAAGGSFADRRPRWSGRAHSSASPSMTACAQRWRRAARPTSCARSWRDRRSSRRAPPPTSSSGSAPRTSRGCGWACCTVRWRRLRRRRRCGRSGPVSSTCSWPPP